MSVEDAAFEEAGGEDDGNKLKARDPSVFAIPWDPPDLDATRDGRPTMLTVSTNEQLTEKQRVYIRTDATVRSNRIWKGRYDRFNGQHFIDALKDALVYPQTEDEPKKKRKDILKAMGEGEGEGNEEVEEEEEEAVEEDAGEAVGEEAEQRDPVAMILNALKFVQEKHDELWQSEELDKLCKEYQRKANEIQETKREWKMRIVKMQMQWGEKLTKELSELQDYLVSIKEDLEDFELRQALRRYEMKKLLKLVKKFVTAVQEKQKEAERKAREAQLQEALHEDSVEEQTVEERQLLKLEAMKRSLLMGIKSPKKQEEKAEKGEESEELTEEEQLNAEQLKEYEQLGENSEKDINELDELTVEEEPVAATSRGAGEPILRNRLTKNGFELPIRVRHFGFKVKKRNVENERRKNKNQHIAELTPVKTYVNEKGTEVKEIPLFMTVPDIHPNKREIQENLRRAVELSEQFPDTNPYELALCKTVGQEAFHQLQIRYNEINRARRLKIPRAGSDLKNLLPFRKHSLNLQSKRNWVKGLYAAGPLLYKIRPPGLGSYLGLAEGMRFLGSALKPRPKFAKIGALRYTAGRTEFVPELRIFDNKTREILRRNKKEEILKLPLSTFRVAESVATSFMEPPGPSEADEHVTFRGTIKKLEGKSLTRIFIEETLSPEEYRRRYKGRKWMERKLSDLYKDFTERKNEVIEKGIVGRQASDRREGLEPTCCPIFWGIANYLRSLLERADGKPVSMKNIPRTFDELKVMFQEVILEMRPELKHRSRELDELLTKWGGYEMCKIDIVSIANLMWILAEIDEIKPYWIEVKEKLVDSSTCPLCLLFNFLKGKNKIPRMRFIGDPQKATDQFNLPKEIMELEKIAQEFKTREKAPIDPALFPDNNLFHIITTEDEHKNPTTSTFRLGQHRDATRLFVMRSCGTVIFDISRSEKEIPWIWSFLKQHMELLDKKDVRDEADVEPMRHLILITNFLSWAKSPKQVKLNISEKTFQQRVPHPDYVGNLKLENTIYYIGVNYKQFKLRTTIIFTGIPFGEEEDVLVYLFKMAWDNELELPLFGNGRNVLPLIHIEDLKWIVVRTVNERTYPAIVFALNKNDQTLFAVASRIAKTFGSTQVVKFPSPDFKMKFCIPKIIDDLLKQNIRYDNIETPYQVRPIWHNPFMRQKKIDEVIKELRDSRKLYGKTIFLIGPPSKAKSELAIIISKLYNLPLIHKGNILNYFLRATQEPEPTKGDGEEEEEAGEEGEEEEEPDKDDEEEGEEKKVKKSADPMAEEKKYLKIMKKMVDGKPANKERKHLTKLLQKLLQSVFIQSHGYVLVDWPIRKEDAIALFTKTLDDPQEEEEIETEQRPPQPPPPRPDHVIHVAATDQYLDETNYFLFQDLCLKSFDEMESDLREYQYYRQTHQSVVDLLEERNNPIYRLTAHDGFKVVGKLIAILGEPQQASGRWIYDMFLKTELACSDEAVKKGEIKMKEAKWLKKRYKHAINELLTIRRERHFSLREQLLGNPLDLFKAAERIPSNLRSNLYDDYKEWREMMGMMKLRKKWTEPSRVWRHVENRRWIASFEKTKEYWMK